MAVVLPETSSSLLLDRRNDWKPALERYWVLDMHMTRRSVQRVDSRGNLIETAEPTPAFW
jgi:hypothetical protein